ncbi:oligopeptide transporter 5-like protein, partial [Tanacetum coccineum]
MMEASLPTKQIRLPGIRWSFSLNPWPLNMKEHALITILANVGLSLVYAVAIITIVKAFYHIKINPLVALLLSQSTQERISKKRTKNEAKSTKPDSEWKSKEKTKSKSKPKPEKVNGSQTKSTPKPKT